MMRDLHIPVALERRAAHKCPRGAASAAGLRRR
jgi:hypothetical protein